jgi:hypothetical protein
VHGNRALRLTAHLKTVHLLSPKVSWRSRTRQALFFRLPDGWANKPVAWFSMADARAYARWAGQRLPHEWEWQYAAQGTDCRKYPWGDIWNPAAVPVPLKARQLTSPDEVVLTLLVPALSASRIWTEAFGNGPTSLKTTTPAPPSCVVDATTSPAAQSGIFPRRIAKMNTESSYSWPRAKIV